MDIENFISFIEDSYGLAKGALCSRRTTKTLDRARLLTIIILYENNQFSFENISKLLQYNNIELVKRMYVKAQSLIKYDVKLQYMKLIILGE